jgi:hypothetical protein
MRVDVSGRNGTMVFDSIDDLRKEVEKHQDSHVLDFGGRRDREFFGGVSSFDGLMELGRTGWESEVQDIIKVSEDTLETIEQTFDIQAWQSVYDVTGSDVDVDRYLSGQPENMISYVMMDTPRVGRVITLAINVGASGIVDPETITARGKNIVALVHALESLGLRTELYADLPAKGSNDYEVRSRTAIKVKSADETLDPAMVMFAFAHPAFMRGFMLTSMEAYPEKFAKGLGVGGGYGIPTEGWGTELFPEGTIEISSNLTGVWDRSMAERFVIKHLRELGIID